MKGFLWYMSTVCGVTSLKFEREIKVLMCKSRLKSRIHFNHFFWFASGYLSLTKLNRWLVIKQYTTQYATIPHLPLPPLRTTPPPWFSLSHLYISTYYLYARYYISKTKRKIKKIWRRPFVVEGCLKAQAKLPGRINSPKLGLTNLNHSDVGKQFDTIPTSCQ